MSIQAINWAMKQTLPCSQKCTLMMLGNFADENGYCYPSQATLAKLTGLSMRSLRDKLLELEEEGLISRAERRSETGKIISDAYNLQLEHTTSCVPAAKSAGGEADQRQNSPLDDTEENTSGKSCLRQNTSQPAANPARHIDEPSIEPYSLSQGRVGSHDDGLALGVGVPAPAAQPPPSQHPAPPPEREVTSQPIPDGHTRFGDVPSIPFEWLVLAQQRGMSREQADFQFAKFRAHYHGNGVFRLNWASVWDKWLLTHQEINQSGKGSQNAKSTGSGGNTADARAAQEAKAQFNAWDTAARAVELAERRGADMGATEDSFGTTAS